MSDDEAHKLRQAFHRNTDAVAGLIDKMSRGLVAE
jgi:hypothetical protein